MRLLSAFLVAVACVAVSSAPLGAQQINRQQSAAGLERAYQSWQQVTDAEEKIALGEQVLALEPNFQAWSLPVPLTRVRAEVSGALGSLYVNRALGVRPDNLEKAIAYLKAALAEWSRETEPIAWAWAQNDLGIAYWQRVRGARADNQESAIAHFEAAQTVFSREAHPGQWAQLQNNLAIVYWNRVNGEGETNLEESIARFKAALTVITRERDPNGWAATQNNLGNAYVRRLRGDGADNREMAIKHLEAALSVFSREASPQQWAQAQNNLAIAYLGRTRGDEADNREQAIAALEGALLVFTREASPQQWALANNNLGQAYAGRVHGSRADNRRKAIARFEAALSVFTRDAAPLDHLRSSRLLGRVLLDAGEWTRVAPVHASAREAFLLLFGQGVSDAEGRAIIADAGPLFADAAYAAVRRGETERAFELANEGRARLLSIALKLQTVDLPPDKRRRLDELRSTLRASQEAADAAHGTERAAAIERLIEHRRELYSLIEIGTRGERPALTEARRLAAAGAVVVMPVITDLGAKLLVVTGAGPGNDLTVVDAPALTTQSLAALLVGGGEAAEGWIGAYFVNYMSREEKKRRWSEWMTAIDGIGLELWERFGSKLDAVLKERGVKRNGRLVWLPSGWLGILPLGLAQDPGSKRRLADNYEIVYAPSLATLAAADDVVAGRRHATLAAVVNPTGDLPGTDREGALVASYFASADRIVLEGSAATPDAVLAALKGKTHWHFASHGTFAWLDARSSGLVLHGGQQLTVGQLLDSTGLGHPRLVVLSACETGLSDVRSSPDEFIGLPGTFTALGAAGVVGTLWPVSDAATALLMSKFYELHLGAGIDPPTALRQAQSWMRQATDGELNGYAKVAAAAGRLANPQLASIEQELRAAPSGNAPGELTTGANAGAGRTGPRYAHPYYWAGFIYTGQ